MHVGQHHDQHTLIRTIRKSRIHNRNFPNMPRFYTIAVILCYGHHYNAVYVEFQHLRSCMCRNFKISCLRSP